MWVLYSLLGLLVLLVAALSMPVFGRITYDGELVVRIRVLGIPVTLTPRPEKKAKKSSRSPKKGSAKKTRKTKAESPSKFKELVSLMKQDDLAGTLHFLHEAARLAAKTVGRVLRSVTVKQLDLQLLIASSEPDVTAKRYGQVCSVLYPALAGIEHVVKIRNRNLRVEPNFLLEQSVVRFDVRLRVSVWRLLGAGIALLWGFLMIKETSDPQTTKEVS